MDFASRHIGPAPDDQQRMLAEVGYPSLAALTVVLCLIAVRVFRWDEI